MTAFEILVNGKRLCVAGTLTADVVSIAVNWVRRVSEHAPDRIQFHVGGLIADRPHEHFGWNTPRIGVGDEVTIRIVEVDACDTPEFVYEPARRSDSQA
jgi:hypothetical protein